jgi:hypothetical protein
MGHSKYSDDSFMTGFIVNEANDISTNHETSELGEEDETETGIYAILPPNIGTFI